MAASNVDSKGPLYGMLRALHCTGEAYILWSDFLCINQAELIEQSEQDFAR
jgi:hypothetical protein